jgi:hypothetical protein
MSKQIDATLALALIASMPESVSATACGPAIQAAAARRDWAACAKYAKRLPKCAWTRRVAELA